MSLGSISSEAFCQERKMPKRACNTLSFRSTTGLREVLALELQALLPYRGKGFSPRSLLAAAEIQAQNNSS